MNLHLDQVDHWTIVHFAIALKLFDVGVNDLGLSVLFAQIFILLIQVTNEALQYFWHKKTGFKTYGNQTKFLANSAWDTIAVVWALL